MISMEDCIAFCGLTAEEVAAIAEHEHLPEIAAATLGRYMLGRANGLEGIQQMIVDDIRAASAAKNYVHAGELLCALKHLRQTHPQTPSCCAPAQAQYK